MIELKGKYASAKIFTVDDAEAAIDQHALAQIQMLCNTEACEGSRIRIMPDVHAGKVGPIGLTMTVGSKVLPALVGNDIGCGVTVRQFKPKKPIDFVQLDKTIRKLIPAGARKRIDGLDSPWYWMKPNFEPRCRDHIDWPRAFNSFATLGGGNHFIEVDVDSSGKYHLTVHSGSRNFGQQIYDWYMREGQRSLKAQGATIPYEMTWLEGALRADYIEDAFKAATFASLSREAIIKEICKAMKWKEGSDSCGWVDSRHNFISCDNGEVILRKGAISSRVGEKVLIPANARDGIIVATGKGNADWNHSAPHGTGRLLKRSDVAKSHTVSEYKKEMKGVWSSCIGSSTLDEAPFAYRDIEAIANVIGEAVDIQGYLKPVYSFKAGSSEA